ncbi:rhodanese-like domain-containing protein [Actinophytocola oryzae]|uniref:Rhodanese-related sulfurtransferase n=1 Tax=Actinophytocola oryzae TaxID=502181 RepID=A0A4R7VWN3_9PSEU|nr:rhodanese-like domain-containing protein [Actinophytocola oryzae]TDV54058.1 rhodanese-related sulfurtransferase [Actinophytocola oryzae]
MSAVDDVLDRARARLSRVSPADLAGLPDDHLLVDIRPLHNRVAEGEIPGAVPVERIVLEWRLDPGGTHRMPGFTAETVVVVFCNEGYSSSLAARDLQEVGLPKATDLVGGFREYLAAGLPVQPGGTQAVT